MPEEIMTNQSEESSESEGDFEIDFSEGDDETPETESEPVADNFSLNVRYNGEDKTLTREEATTLAQKGMNYDKIYEQLQSAKNDPRLKVFEAQANELGISLDEYAQRLSTFQEQSAKNQIAREFMADNPDATDDIAKAYAEQAYKNKQHEKKVNSEAEQQKKQKENEDFLAKEIKNFQSHFPDVDIRTLPTDVVDDINNGTPLLQAYLMYENRELHNRLSANETNNANRNRNVSGIADNNAGSTGDPFLDGLLGK